MIHMWRFSTIPWAKLEETIRNITGNKTFEVLEIILTTELLSNTNKTVFIFRKTSSNFRIFVPAFNSSSPDFPKNDVSSLILEQAHVSSNLSFIELHNFEVEHTLSFRFMNFSGFSSILDTDKLSFDLSIFHYFNFYRVWVFRKHKSSDSSLIKLDIWVCKLIKFE